MLTLWNQIDDLFGDELLRQRRRATKNFVPLVDIVESPEAYHLTADVPGVSPEALSVSVDQGVLTIEGKRESEESAEGKGYRRVERTVGAFSRSFVLPKGIPSDRIEAKVDHGQLRVTVPKPSADAPKKTQVPVQKVS